MKEKKILNRYHNKKASLNELSEALLSQKELMNNAKEGIKQIKEKRYIEVMKDKGYMNVIG